MSININVFILQFDVCMYDVPKFIQSLLKPPWRYIVRLNAAETLTCHGQGSRLGSRYLFVNTL